MTSYWKRFSILGFLGFCVSAYLIFHFTSVTRGYQNEKSFCSINTVLDCETVAQSGWSSFLGIPVAGWALTYYLVLKILVWRRESEQGREAETAHMLLAYSFLSLPPSLLLLGVSHFTIGKYCLMCGLLDLCNLLLFIVALKCPARTLPVLPALRSGMSSLIKSFFTFSSPRGIAPGLLLWVATFLGLLAAGAAPNVLVRGYFGPREQSYYDRDYLKTFVDAWRRTPVSEVPIHTDSGIDKDFTLGSPAAPVKIVTFSDFECPFCKKTAAYLKPFLEKNSAKVQLIFKSYPLDHGCNDRIKTPKHEFACRAAGMVLCAGVQGDELFWKMHDRIMDMESLSEAQLADAVKKTGVHEGAFNQCLADPNTRDRVRRDIAEGDKLQVVSTPSIFINGRKVQVMPHLLPGVLMQIVEEVEKKGASR